MAKYKNDAFEFSTPVVRVRKYELEPRVGDKPIALNQDPPMQAINGRFPDSQEEWRVAVALWRLKIPFSYQVRIESAL